MDISKLILNFHQRFYYSWSEVWAGIWEIVNTSIRKQLDEPKRNFAIKQDRLY